MKSNNFASKTIISAIISWEKNEKTTEEKKQKTTKEKKKNHYSYFNYYIMDKNNVQYFHISPRFFAFNATSRAEVKYCLS